MPRFGPLVALISLLCLAPSALAATAQDNDEPDALRATLHDLRGEVAGALETYARAHADFEASPPESDAQATAREGMTRAGNRVGEAFLRFESGHGHNASLNAFMQGRMPPSFYKAFERHVVLLRALMLQARADEAPASAQAVASQGNLVIGALDRAEGCMPDGCRGNLAGAAAQAFVVLVREGFEAILLVGAVVAYLRKSNRTDRIRHVKLGVLAGLALTGLTWIGLRFVFHATAQAQLASRALIEGVTMLLAAGILFYVSFWLISKVESRKWQQYLDGKVKDSLATDRAWALGAIGFLAIYREGVETALFLEALAVETGGDVSRIALGLILGAAALAAIYYAVHHLGVKIPLRPFFAATSALLYFLAVRFLGLAVFEFQEAGVLGVTPIAGGSSFLAHNPLWSVLLQDIGGFTPTLEGAWAQGLLVAVAAAAGAYTWWNGRSRRAHVTLH